MEKIVEYAALRIQYNKNFKTPFPNKIYIFKKLPRDSNGKIIELFLKNQNLL